MRPQRDRVRSSMFSQSQGRSPRQNALATSAGQLAFEHLECRSMLTSLPLLSDPAAIEFSPVATPQSDVISPLGQFNLFVDAALTTSGLTASFVNQSLRARSIQDDWRVSQVISGTRVDAQVDFTANGWGSRASVGLTGGSDADWNSFSVQWDGYVQIVGPTFSLSTRSDDSSRMWIDLDTNGTFGTTSPELVDNHWGVGQAPTTGPPSALLSAGVYKIRLQYEEGTGGNVMQLLPTTLPLVRIGYVIPSNRTAQPNAVANLQETIQLHQQWYREQMDRNGFGPKTFRYETEADGVTPKVHIVNVPDTDDYLRGDLWTRVNAAAAAAGVPTFASGQVWLLVPETSLQNADGTIIGGTALGASNGSGSDGGIGMIGSAGIALISPGGLANNQTYAGQIVPQIGPYALVQDVSFPWFELTTFSSTASSWLGASLHELSHAFGLPHDFRNDANFHGNLMGNGLRGYRGAFYPSLYPSDDTYLSYGQALVLNSSRYFNAQYAAETTAPTLSVTTSGSVALVNGQLEIGFTASDAGGLAAAYLDLDASLPREIPLSGTSVTSKFVTPYFAVGAAQKFYVSVYDIYGNRSRSEVTITPTAGPNLAPKPFFKLSRSTVTTGTSVQLDASGTTDPDHATSTLLVEWDTNGDGTFDTAPTAVKTLSLATPVPGAYRIGARITDPAGAVSLAEPIALRVLANVAPAIAMTPTSGLQTSESGLQASFTVVLATRPTSTVTIGLTSNDTSEGTVSPAQLVFTPATWNTPRTVTVTGVDDGSADGSVAYTIVTAAATSTDSAYAARNALDVSVTNLDNDQVVARRAFYNNSAFDGGNSAANAADDAAIATGKTALLPGAAATIANYTSYSRGVNGIMVDFSGSTAAIVIGDFTFRVGNNNSPGGWGTPVTPALSIRNGAGLGGSNRLTLTWPDGVIKNQWLQVTLAANAHTGLAAPDVFYFGNAVGESGDSPNHARVNSTDEIAARNHPQSFLNPATLANAYDFNRDGFVNATDQILARSHATTAANALALIQPPALLAEFAGPAALAESDFDFSDIAAALALLPQMQAAISPNSPGGVFLPSAISPLPLAGINPGVSVTEPAVSAANLRRMHAAAGEPSTGDDYLYELIAAELVACHF